MPKPNTKLFFGPYKTPPYKYGQIVMDDAYGEVKIIGTSAAKIPWPMHRRGSGRPIPVLYKDLAKAVRNEMFQSVQHHWGVSTWTVDRWRKALKVPTSNKATHMFRVAYGKKHRQRTIEAFRPHRSSPERAAKIAAAKRGKPRPKHVVEAIRRASLGRRHSAEARQRMSAAQKRRGAWPPAPGKAWSAAEDELVRTLPAAEVAKRTKRTLSAVYARRRKFGLNQGRTERWQTQSVSSLRFE